MSRYCDRRVYTYHRPIDLITSSSDGGKYWIITAGRLVCVNVCICTIQVLGSVITRGVSSSFVVFQCGEGSARSRCRPKRRRSLQQRLRHVTGERHPLTGRWKPHCVCIACICVCGRLLHIWIPSAEPDIMRHYDLHKYLHICTCFISSVLFILYVLWQAECVSCALLSSSRTYTQARWHKHTHTHTSPPLSVLGFCRHIYMGYVYCRHLYGCQVWVHVGPA